MASGLVDVLGFIGGTKGADAIIKQHPSAHRLKVFAQLEGTERSGRDAPNGRSTRL